MEVRRCNHRIGSLLALLLFGASAAAPSAEHAAREARTAINRAKYDDAARIIDDALTHFGSQQNEAVWSLRVMRGELFNARGKYADVKKALAAEPPPNLRNSVPAVRRLLELAFAAYGLADETEVIRLLMEARAIAVAHQPRVLTEVYGKFGALIPDPSKAEEYGRKALAEAKRYKDRINEAKAMAILQFRYVRNQRFDESIELGELAHPLARSLQLEKLTGSIEGHLGWAYLEIGDYESAVDVFTSAEATAKRIGADNDRVAWLIQLGNLRYQQRDWQAADRYYREAIAFGEPIKHRQLGLALANLAVVAMETGRFADAQRFNTEALKWKRAAKDEDGELRSLIVEARIAGAAGQLDAAVKTLRRVIAESDKPVTRWEAEARLGEILAKGRRMAQADQSFRLAIDTAREARLQIDREELRLSFFNTAEDIFTAYVDFLVDQGRAADALSVTEISRAQTLEEGLGIPPPEKAREAASIAREQRATILCYWLGPKRSYVWKVTSSRVTVTPLAPEEKIRTAVEAYRQSLLGAHGMLPFIGARGEQLHKLLGIPTDLAPGSRVIVIPDGNLHALNFETLVVPLPKPHHWIEDVNVVAASSMQLLGRPEAPLERSPRMLLIGNPPQVDPAFPRLRRASDEIASIARHFPPARLTVLRDSAATPAAYRGSSPENFDFVHFVAHGVATRQKPLQSAVILGPDATKHFRLLARDVVKQPLRARLVTISSCHGAGTRAYAGEGLVGLAWAFLRAGAANVIAALWEVDDSAAPLLMDDVYRAIQSGQDPATALRAAKLELLRSNGAYRRPRYWAPFVLYAGR